MKATPAQLAAYVGKSERTIHRWLASGKWPHKRLPGGLVEVDDSLLTPPEEGQENVIPAILATLTRLEQKIDDLAATVGAMSASPPTHPPYRIHTERATYTPAQPPGQGELPEGLVSLHDFCKERGYSETTLRRRAAEGKISIHEGKWKRGKVYILRAVDEEERAAIDRLYGRA